MKNVKNGTHCSHLPDRTLFAFTQKVTRSYSNFIIQQFIPISPDGNVVDSVRPHLLLSGLKNYSPSSLPFLFSSQTWRFPWKRRVSGPTCRASRPGWSSTRTTCPSLHSGPAWTGCAATGYAGSSSATNKHEMMLSWSFNDINILVVHSRRTIKTCLINSFYAYQCERSYYVAK